MKEKRTKKNKGRTINMLRNNLWLGLFAALAFTFTSSTEGSTVNTKISDSRDTKSSLEVTTFGNGLLSGSFTTDGYTIYFEAVRGEANEMSDPNASAYDPDAPAYGLDIRVMDSNHMPFLTQVAGSTPVISSWGADDGELNAFPVNSSERFRAFSMLPATVKSLKAYAKQKNTTISDLDQSDLNQVIAMLESVKSADLQDSDSIQSETLPTEAVTATYTHKTFIMRKDALFNGFSGDHSAILLRIYSSGGALVRQWNSCNHGTCATSSAMYSKCYKPFVKANTIVPTMDRACEQFGSPYLLLGGSPYVYGHFCNNDTRQQYLSIKGSANWNWGICYFRADTLAALYRRAPGCD